MRGTEGNLLGFSKEIVRPAIQHHAADHFQRHQLFRDKLRRVQMIEREAVRLLLREKLNREFPLGEIAGCDGLEHIAAMEVLIGAANLDGLIPNGGLQAELRTPVEFDESRFPFLVNQPETMYAKAFDHAQRTRQSAVRHRSEEHT